MKEINTKYTPQAGKDIQGTGAAVPTDSGKFTPYPGKQPQQGGNGNGNSNGNSNGASNKG